MAPDPVAHQHVVGDPDRNLLAVGGIDGEAPGENSRLLLALLLALHEIPGGHLRAVCLHRRPLLRRGEPVHVRMLGRQHHVRRAEQGVRPGCEDLDHPVPGRERDFRPLAAANPVGLGLLRDVRPVDLLEVAEQPLGVPGNLEEPLGQAALLHRRLAALAEPRDHLLVREHGQARWAPVHRCLAALHQAALEELEEHPLRPAVVRRVRGVHRVVPVVHAAEALQLPREVGDVLGDEFVRVRADLERVVLRVDAERIEAHGFEHVLAAQAPVSSVRVGAHVRVHVPDVQPLRRRIGEHHQVVVGVLGGPAALRP